MESRLVLSEKGKKVRNIVIMSDGDWASWVHILPLFHLSGQLQGQVTIYTPCRSKINLFGMSRTTSVQWKKFDITHQCLPALQHSVTSTLHQSDLILFHGSLASYQSFLDITSGCQVDTLVCIPGSARLRQLKQGKHLQWTRINHYDCGGASSISCWLGSSVGLRDGVSPVPPQVCHSSMKDLVEFVPDNMTATVIMAPEVLASTLLGRQCSTMPHATAVNTWWSHGLFPCVALRDLSSAYIATPTPFTKTKWCCWNFTAKEIAWFLDMPVDCERRIGLSFKGSVPSAHPLLMAIPLKLLSRALWFCGFCDDHRGFWKLIKKFQPQML
jgi:hypothetical protein